MASESRQTLVRRLFDEGWNAGNPVAVGDIIHEDYDSNDGGFFVSGSEVPGGLQRLSGAEAFARHLADYRTMYDNLHFDVERMFDTGEAVVSVWDATGTSTTETFVNRGGQEVPRELKARGVSLTEVVDGKIARHDLFWPRSPLFP